jgi:hypothetical protein
MLFNFHSPRFEALFDTGFVGSYICPTSFPELYMSTSLPDIHSFHSSIHFMFPTSGLSPPATHAHAVNSGLSPPAVRAVTSGPSPPAIHAVTSGPSPPVIHAVNSGLSPPAIYAVTSGPSPPVIHAVTQCTQHFHVNHAPPYTQCASCKSRTRTHSVLLTQITHLDTFSACSSRESRTLAHSVSCTHIIAPL